MKLKAFTQPLSPAEKEARQKLAEQRTREIREQQLRSHFRERKIFELREHLKILNRQAQNGDHNKELIRFLGSLLDVLEYFSEAKP